MTSLLAEALRTSVVLGLALGFVACLSRHSAAARHWILLVGLAAACVSPVFSLVAPAWGPSWHRVRAVEVAWKNAWTPLLPGADSGLKSSPRDVGQSRVGSAPAPSEPQPRPTTDGEAVWPSASGLILAVWIGGTGVGLLGLITGLWRLRRLSERSRPISSARVDRAGTDVSHELGLRRRVRLLEGEASSAVVMWGWARPRVLLPRGVDEWSEERLRVVLSHEFAHIRRGDWATQLAAEGLRRVQWFNPFVWLACQRLREESEQACDDIVLSRGVDAQAYATHLVDLARATRSRRRWVPAPAVARQTSLEKRIVAMLNKTSNRQVPSEFARALAAAGFILIALVVAGFGAAAQSATVSGAVVDQTGHVVPAATLRFFNRETQEAETFPADQSGQFASADLPPGIYSITVTKPGFTRQFRRLELRAGERREEWFTLELGRLEETITVVYTGEERIPRPVTANGLRRPRQASSDQQILPPVKIRDLAPRYPESARESGFEAKVMLDAVITADGFIEVHQILVPVDPETMVTLNSDIARAAVDAVRQWQYEPTRLHGVPVDTSMDISVTFRAE